jgi:phosphoglycerate dehydrogenase-like enzyme
MHVHIQNHTASDVPVVTADDWESVKANIAAPTTVTFGSLPEHFRAVAGEVEVLVVHPKAMAGLLPLNAPHLRIVACTWAGLEMLAPFNWLPDGVALLNSSGAHARKGSEYVLMALLLLVNHMPELLAAQEQRRWSRVHGTSLRGRRLTVLGLGAIGGASATLARTLGMKVTGVRRTPSPHPDCEAVVGVRDLDAILPDSDYLVIALPSSSATANLIDRRRLSLLPRHAGIINVGRGAVLDEEALCDRLDAQLLAGAVLDVFQNEPVPPNHRLWTTRNLIITPHVSSDDLENVSRLTVETLAANLNAFATGRPMPNVFDPVSGTRVRT